MVYSGLNILKSESDVNRLAVKNFNILSTKLNVKVDGQLTENYTTGYSIPLKYSTIYSLLSDQTMFDL